MSPSDRGSPTNPGDARRDEDQPKRRPYLKPVTIAIDGPGASGKSTVGELLAERLDYLYFDTGAMYRAVTWAALDREIPLSEEAAVTRLAHDLEITITDATQDDERQYTVLVDDIDVTWEIRSPVVDASVSTVAAYPGVREALVQKQRIVAARQPVVMVGRDIGTAVLPDADLKIYLDATVEERARRRWLEMRNRGDAEVDYEDVLDSMRRRDRVDKSRDVSPLRAASDAVVIDTTHLTIDQVVDEAHRLVQEQGCP